MPHSENTIAAIDFFGSNPQDEGENFLYLFDTIYIVDKDSIHYSKDIYQRENWSYDRDIVHVGLIKSGTNYYTLTVEDVDFN
jgi:hypothetical protein